MASKTEEGSARLARYLFGEMTFGEYWMEAKAQGRDGVLHFEVLDETSEARKRRYDVSEVEERADHLMLRNSDPDHFVLAATIDWGYKVKPTSLGLVVEDKGVRVAVKFSSDVDWDSPPPALPPSSCSP